MSLSPGSRLGPYEILAPLGAGGMGEVYRARDHRLDRDVALKVVAEKLANDATALARFEREAKAVAALSHPNIVAIHDFSKEHDVWYAVTEFLQGQTLQDRLDRGPLPWKAAVEIALEIGAGLAAAHDRGIVHRDLKPGNVFLTQDNRVKILDFGLAAPHLRASVSPTDTTASLTVPGQVVGTYGYMSPEQIRGEAADARSDIFSFGCVLYELIAGRNPFAHPGAAETMAAMLKDDPTPLPAGIAVPDALEALILRCLEKRPENRFQSVRDLNFALKQILKEEPSSRGREQAAPVVESIAVLPFENLSGPDQEFSSPACTTRSSASSPRSARSA